ncbi:hypothetical protein RYX36_033196, partial [Vicia faba]
WLIDIEGFAKKVKRTTLSSADQIKDCGAYRECPNCHWRIDNSDVSSEWPGFPLGIKFDPSDVELLDHLAAKCGVGNTNPHMFIDEFIPTLEGDQGICYTHPENLPGAKKDGSSVHFFHRTMNAYSTSQRKRRKIQHHGSAEDHVRWHKTGKTKAVIEDGVHKGYKKIMVLYIRSEKESKSYKSDWKMHQYHLGTGEDEKNGEYVVSKIFYKHNEKNEEKPMAEESDNITSRTKGFAKKVKRTTLSSADQIKDCGAYRECPNCHWRIDNSDVSSEWPGFPLGIKFDPSDVELLDHLAAKCGVGNTNPHMFIDEFIPTLEGDQGICYTHPENLPGAKKDGSSVHFFHRTMNAYSTSQRKRRKIQHHGSAEDHVRWHKTGKTKAVIEDGVHKGYKKIMVLYIRSEKESKSYKSDWKMHQYHLGTGEDEKNGEYVVSKIFYKHNEKNEEKPMAEESDNITSRT